jgi:hypothetical protein
VTQIISTILKVELEQPKYMTFLGLLIIIFIIITISFLIIYIKKKKRKYFLLTIISIVILVCGILLEIYIYQDYQYQLNYDILEYSVELNSLSEESEIVYIPVSENPKIQESIKINYGDCKKRIIEIERGKALELNFTGKTRLYGKIEITEGIGNHDFTMEVQSQTRLRRRIEYWIFYNPSDQTNYNCSLKLKLEHEALDYFETHYIEGYLEAGWNTYWASHSALS